MEKIENLENVTVPDMAEILLKKNKRIKSLEDRLEGLKALWGNGFWSEDEAYDSVIQFKAWTANQMMKLLGFPVLNDQLLEESRT